MSTGPLFSIIVPVYKVEAYLDKCVRSLTEQTYRDIEIILVDDGSPDRCPQMCDTYAERDERITVIHQKNGGLSAARNRGILAARGEYILFLDSDDYITLDACERLVPFVEKNYHIVIGDGIPTGGAKRLAHGSLPIGQVTTGKDYLKKAMQQDKMPMPVWLCVYQRAYLLENNLLFKEGILHEDEQFTPRVFLAAQRVAESGVCFYHYVIRDDSITTKRNLRKNAEDFYATCLELGAVYENLEDPELKRVMHDSLSVKYLSLFQQGKLYQYGKDYVHKGFVWKNAYRMKTKSKAMLFCIAPKLYWHINHISKLRKKK